MSNTAAILPRGLPLIARSEERTLLRPVPPVDELFDDAPLAEEDTRGWIEVHLDKLLAFVGSAALAAVVVSRLMPAAKAPPIVPPAATKVAAPAATPAPRSIAVAPVAVTPMPVEVTAPPSEEIAPPAVQPVVYERPKVAKHATKKAHAKHHAKARLHRAVARVARPDPEAADVPSPADGLIAKGTDALHRHDEAAAIRDFEKARSVDAASGRKLPADVRQKLGLLHVAAALRDRRAGNEAGAHMEFVAAHRADPDNARAASEAAAPQDEVELRDAIDPD